MNLVEAVVESSQDPEQRFRLLVRIPGARDAVWALPCLPASMYTLPEAGAAVWVTPVDGQPEQLVWLGVLPRRTS